MSIRKNAEVVDNGRGDLFAQVAENGQYRCWELDAVDVARFKLRVYDEIVIEFQPEDQFCKVTQLGLPED